MKDTTKILVFALMGGLCLQTFGQNETNCWQELTELENLSKELATQELQFSKAKREQRFDELQTLEEFISNLSRQIQSKKTISMSVCLGRQIDYSKHFEAYDSLGCAKNLSHLVEIVKHLSFIESALKNPKINHSIIDKLNRSKEDLIEVIAYIKGFAQLTCRGVHK